MKASQLIDELQRRVATYGDLDVFYFNHDDGFIVIRDVEVDYQDENYPVTLCVSLIG